MAAPLYVGEVSEHAVIFNEHGEILLLQHNAKHRPEHPLYGRWHLPGGRLDLDDQPGAALLREIEEETQIKGVRLILPCHCSRWGFGTPVKYSVAYLATVEGRPDAVLSPDDDHMAARWVPWKDALGGEYAYLTPTHTEVIAAVAAWGKKLGVIHD